MFFMSSVFTCRQLDTIRQKSGRKYVHTGFSFKKIGVNVKDTLYQ